MRMRCPHCNAKLTVPDEWAGKKGRCPACKGSVLIEAPADAPLVTAVQPPRAGGLGSPAPTIMPGSSSGSSLGSVEEAYDLAPSDGAHGDDGRDFGLSPVDDDAPLPPPAVMDPYKKTRRERLQEIEDLRADGNQYLWRIRLLLLGLGALMLVYNIFLATTINSTIELFKQAVNSNRRAFGQINTEQIADLLRTAMTLEVALYIALGVIFCGLALLIHKAPVIATWGALGTYAGAWVLDYILAQVFFGDIIAGQLLFSFGTVIKVGIIGGLWYGVQVGQAYEEQILRPQRELEEADDEDEEDDES